jgi:TRAP transporter TAXI family solute receptor
MRAFQMKMGITGVLLLAITFIASNSFAKVISLTTLQPGSIYHTTGTVIAKVVTEKSDLQMLVQPYGSSAAGMFAVNAGDAEFAFADINDVLSALYGKHAYKGRQIKNLQLASRIRPISVGLFVRKNADIHVMKDFKGKRLPAKYAGFPNGVALLEGIYAASGMTKEDVKGVPTPSLIPAVNDFMAGKMDAGFFAVGGPKVAEANASLKGIRFIPLPNTPEALKAMQNVRSAYYIRVVNPAPPNVGIIKPTPLLTFDQVIVAGPKVPAELVYKVLKVLNENKKALVAGFPPLGGFMPDQMGRKYPGIIHHPGAEKLYKEKGIW